MKKLFILICLQTFGMAGFSQSPLFPHGGTSLPYTNLVVRWETSKHPWPKTLWTYQMTRMELSPSAISNLMVLGLFNEKNKRDKGTDGILYSSDIGLLGISLPAEDIFYMADRESADFVKNVPGTNQVYQLATNFLPKLGIGLSEISKRKDGHPNIICIEYYQRPTAWFYRAIDGAECDSDIGSGRIDYGEDSRIFGIILNWGHLEPEKLYSTATSGQIIQWIRAGKAVFPQVDDQATNKIFIDWPKVKSIAIKKAKAYYWSEYFLGKRERPPEFPRPVTPYAELQATIDVGESKINTEIDCPIIDETKTN